MPAISPRIVLDDETGVPVIRLVDSQILDDRTTREVHEAIDAAVASTSGNGPIRLILDLSGVNIVSSAFIGRLVLLQRRVDRSNGNLRLCELGRGVADVLRTTNLDRVFRIARDRREAREAFS